MTDTPTSLHPDIYARIQRICQAVADEACVLVGDLYSPYRGTAKVSRARHLAMAVVRQTTGLTLAEIAQHFGGRNYATAIHAWEVIMRLKEGNPEREAHWQKLISL